MKTCVVGAGISIEAGYPSGPDLLAKLIEFAKQKPHSHLARRCEELQAWLQSTSLPGIKAAYQASDLEHLLTQLDISFSVGWIMYERRKGGYARDRMEGDDATREYSDYVQHPEAMEAEQTREHLKEVLSAFFKERHSRDQRSFQESGWDSLKQFGRKLSPGDVVVTFNFDSCLERVLLEQGDWSPQDGYGFTREFRRSPTDASPVSFCPSRVKVLHLHGSVGWCRDRTTSPDGKGYFDVDWDDAIWLGPELFQGFGIDAVDAPRSVPSGTLRESMDLIIYPSFVKNYARGRVFADLWRQAADALKAAEGVTVIGYSLPGADVAAWTLLKTTCDGARVQIVNSCSDANERLRRMLGAAPGPPLSFADWLAKTPDTSR